MQVFNQLGMSLLVISEILNIVTMTLFVQKANIFSPLSYVWESLYLYSGKILRGLVSILGPERLY